MCNKDILYFPIQTCNQILLGGKDYTVKTALVYINSKYLSL